MTRRKVKVECNFKKIENELFSIEKITALIALALLVTGFILLIISVNKGKRIVEYLKRKYPKQWEDFGSPKPGYFQSLERNRWNKFIWSREYVQFDDQKLTEMGDAQRNFENFILGIVFAFVLVGGILAWLELIG